MMFNFGRPEIAPSFMFSRYKDRFIVALNTQYEFSVRDIQGKTLATMGREVKREKLSTAERDYLLKNMKEERDWPDWIMGLIRKNMPKTKR